MTMFSQDQVNQWFGANPNATPEQVASAVQSVGGLDTNPGLAGMIGQHYGTDASTVSDLYSQILGRAPDEGGLAYWQQQFGDTIDPNEVATFKTAAAPELAMTGYTPPASTNAFVGSTPYFSANPDVAAAYQQNSYGLTPEQFAQTHYEKYGANEQRDNPYTDVVSQWAAANPTASPYQITQAVADAGGLNPVLADAIARQYGTTVDAVNSGYQTNQGINSLYQTYLGRAPESQAVVDQWMKQFGSTIDPNEIAAFRQAAAPELAQTHYLSTPMRGDIQQYVSGVLADNSLSDWEKTNKIMEQAQKSGITQSQIEDVFGKQNVQPYMDTYKKGIASFLGETLAKEQGTTMNEVGAIHQAAQKYGLTPDEIAKYGGLELKEVQSYFDQYNQGLGTIMSRLNDPKVDDVTKTQTALALQQKYGTTDAELAKASKGKYTEADVKAYLDPVRNVPTNLQKLFDDPNASAADITKFINQAKADPRAVGIYGAALDKISANTPALYLRDAATGAADVSDSYEKFLAVAKSTPELATQYAPQIKAIEQAKTIIGKHALNKDFGGEYKDYAMQMFLGLDKKTQNQVPKQLEMTAPKTQTLTGVDENNELYTYNAVQPAELKSSQKGFEPIYGPGDEYSPGAIEGYRKKVDSEAFNATGKPVYALYDANGRLTGYESNAHVHINDPQWYGGKWDADGRPTPTTGANRSGGFFKNTLQDIASLGPAGQIALMAATGGLGSAVAAQLGGGLLANAAASGLISGALSDVAGGSFEKGFLGGAVGSGVGSLVNASMPANVTGNAFVDSYLSSAAPNVASNMARAGVMGADMGDAGLASLLNTGLNMGTNSLINAAMPDTLSPTQQQWASGIGSGLIKSAITGQPIDVNKTIQNTALQQALQLGRKG